MTPTDDQLLPPDDLRAIEARAEAYEKASEAYTEACATTLWLSTPKTRDAEYDARIALDRAEDEFDTHARADIPALLAHIRAQAAENARLRDALGEILDSPIARNSWDGSCAICGEWHGYGSDKDADCPLGRAQGALKHATNTR